MNEVVIQQLIDRGFRVSYRSTAVTLLVHPDLPGLEVRIGTVAVVAERDGIEVYRRPLASFSLNDLLARASSR